MHKLLQLFKTAYHPQLVDAMMKANFSGALLVNALIPVVIFYLFVGVIPLIQLEAWSAVNLTIFLLRMVLQKKITKKINIHLLLLAITSLLYAILPWLVLIYSDAIHLLLVAMIIASIVAGSIATIVSIYHIFFTFVVIQMLGLISAFLYMNEDIFYLSALLATSLLQLVITSGYKQYENLTETLRLNKQVNNLLNNTGEGFLSFDTKLKCQSSFSNECLHIFQTDTIEEKDISQLLFANDDFKRDIFKEAIERSLQSDNEEMTEMFLSLIPQEHRLNNLDISIECKQLECKNFMLILKDITATKKLESKIEYQHKVQQLLINVASNKNDFIDLKNDFEQLLQLLYTNSTLSLSNIDNIKKELHTFKGNFSQKGMIYISHYIHELELKLQNISSREEIISTFLEANLQEPFNKDIAVIDAALGEEFLNSTRSINVDIDAISAIEFELKSFVYKFNLEQQIALNTILSDIHKLKNIPLKEMLKPYVVYVEQMSQKLGKELYPLLIDGNDSLKVSPRLKLFMKQLIHIFNNAIDHGIEDFEDREAKGKDGFGKIECSYTTNAEILIVTISDDGRGLDTQKLAESALKKGIRTEEELKSMSEEVLTQLIFEESFSTKESVSSISGIGIGLSALKAELDHLQGKVLIENSLGEGLKFNFYIPLHTNRNLNLFYSAHNCSTSESILTTLITQSELFVKKAMNTLTSTSKTLEISDTDILFSQITLSKDFKGKVILLYSQNILQAISEYMIPEGFEESEKDEIYQDVADETINTIVGLSLQYFDKSLGEIEISPPLSSSDETIFTLIENRELHSIATIETQKGTLGIIVLNEDA